ncbi:heat shock protein beta-1 [Cololabis saira]|uniref:heat shock protein beta-1 n=1 Tax=Cololabis saira TaxID=129043 RepID=UPI002AD4EB3E|nr:heat shock protein beta-1 [Cololabis saira]
MSEQAAAEMPCGDYDRATAWYPLRKWWQPGRPVSRELGLPPFLEAGDPRWMDVDRLQRSFCSWLGYIPTPLFVPYISESMAQPGQKISKWRVSLDVAQFSTSEVSVSVRDGFLEVGGKHEERLDEHGSVARCFTKKYRLPAEVDVTKIVSTLSADGILTVEAPVPEAAFPAAVIIPVKVEVEAAGDQEVKENQQEESQSEVREDQDQAAGTSAELEHEGMEARDQPAGEADPSAPADEESTESLQQSPVLQETLESHEIMETSEQLEQTEQAVEVEIPVTVEVAQELVQPEQPELGESPPSDVQSPEPEAADVKQVHIQ